MVRRVYEHYILFPDIGEGRLPHIGEWLHCPYLFPVCGSIRLSRKRAERVGDRHEHHNLDLSGQLSIQGCLFSSRVGSMIAGQVCTASCPANYNKFHCLTDGGHLVQNPYNGRTVKWATMETVQRMLCCRGWWRIAEFDIWNLHRPYTLCWNWGGGSRRSGLHTWRSSESKLEQVTR